MVRRREVLKSFVVGAIGAIVGPIATKPVIDRFTGPIYIIPSGGSDIGSFYTGMTLVHNGQTRIITDYDGATKTATLDSNMDWNNEPATILCPSLHGRAVTML